jgi:hypothetical protein
MSTNSNTPNNSEEVDLGQLFKLIGNAFDRFFSFIGSIFKNIFLAFVWLVLFIKKRIILLVSATILGLVTGSLSKKTAAPKYESSVTVVQNYPTGENLYNSVGYYNDLLRQKDYETLGAVLDLDLEKTKSILGFDVQPVISENNKLVAFNKYIKQLDSLAASKIEYEDFLANNEDYTHKYQQISISSTERNSFKSVFENIVKSINENSFFLNEQKKDITELTQTKEALELALSKSQSLQDTYKRVLEQGLNEDQTSKTSEIGITFEGSSETEKTKEYELYQNDLDLRSQLVRIERMLLDKQYIIEMISNKQDSGFASNSKIVFGRELSVELFYGLGLFLLAFMVLLGIEFLKFIEQYKKSV